MAKKISKATGSMLFALGSLLSRLEWGEDYEHLEIEIKNALLKKADRKMLVQLVELCQRCLRESSKAAK